MKCRPYLGLFLGSFALTWAQTSAAAPTASSVGSGAAVPGVASLNSALPLSSAVPLSDAVPSASVLPSSSALPLSSAAPSASPSSTVAPALRPLGATCKEQVPEGKLRPKVTEQFPERGKSGYAAVLTVDIEHGPGERVLPSALEVDKSSTLFRSLASAGFHFPAARGPAAPSLKRTETAGQARTRFELPLLLLPSKPGQSELVLPSLPIAIARASGELITLCTVPHRVLVEDPTANEPNALPKRNPPAQRQRELWETLRNGAYGGGAGLVLAGVLAFALRAWLRRTKKAPPAPPPRPPWEVALEALHDIRMARLIEAARFDEHFDRVSHVLRRYLGDRYGFEALESTTEEILAAMLQRAVPAQETAEVRHFLGESDLVKFANMTPTEAQCHWLWETAERVVKETLPKPALNTETIIVQEQPHAH